jgi:hypothetical protein
MCFLSSGRSSILDLWMAWIIGVLHQEISFASLLAGNPVSAKRANFHIVVIQATRSKLPQQQITIQTGTVSRLKACIEAWIGATEDKRCSSGHRDFLGHVRLGIDDDARFEKKAINIELLTIWRVNCHPVYGNGFGKTRNPIPGNVERRNLLGWAWEKHSCLSTIIRSPSKPNSDV